MKRIGVISDTHGYWDEQVEKFFAECDEIWHAGDIGNIETAVAIEKFRPLKAVYGNIDDFKVRSVYPKLLRFNCEEVDVLMTHIGGYPGKYDSQILPIIKSYPPLLFICGHSHILKVIYDKKYDFLHINPGALGKSGFHNLRTAVRFTIDGKDIRELEIIEIPRG
ncbi:MAG: YfcE family phosphodiesterase [Bacteroidetes bacterium HGW-Bacteroidetes-15]|nr:MAG: YfcE family phosphodiesterase [Bacteroidetes bacterium HGW-Bacteroidetes-15]